MLAKEDVLLWFKDLDSYKRIDVMYELLNMCIPFEIRFLGSCIEEIGKHTYQELRGPSIIANDVDRLAKDPSLQTGLADESTRHRAVIYMSVLSARNCSCANWYYRTLFRTTDPIENVVKVTSKEDSTNVISELLLLYTIGLYHPAFTFEQKTSFGTALRNLVDYCNATQEALPRNVSSHNDVVVPAKVCDPLPIQHHAPPPGLPPLSIAPNVLLARSTGFPPSGTVVGAPEVRPFTAQSATSLVNQASSPPQSRALSPHPHLPLRPLLSTCLHPSPIEMVPSAPPMHLDTNLLVSPGGPVIAFNSPPELAMKNNEEENHFISDEKQREMVAWPNDQLLKQNGLRYTSKNYLPPEQLANMKIDGDKHHGSNSNSSSSSSRNQSPIETPTGTPAVMPHGPGRGGGGGGNNQQQQQQQQQVDAKPRVNGLPPAPTYIATCDHQPQHYNTVPSFPNFPPRYYQFRPPFPNSFPIPGNELLYNYHQYYYSSVPPTPRNPNCCNCGGLGHTSVECTAQSVEHITQTPYTLDYESATLPDNPPEK